jgi:hypothetical protein
MTHTLFAKMVAAGLVVMVAGTARAQGGDENGAVTKLQIPQIAVTNAMAQTPVAAADFRSEPPVWPSQQQHAGTPGNSRNSHSRQIWSGVAFGLMGLFAGTSIGQATGRQCRCNDGGMQRGMIGGLVGATLGATIGVRLGR